jgi:broad specificity phosphatase PhoE
VSNNINHSNAAAQPKSLPASETNDVSSKLPVAGEATSAVTTLWLVRHGEAENNKGAKFGGWDCAALTQHGVIEAQATGRHIAHLINHGSGAYATRPTHIVSSDLPRAYETAQAIAAATGLALTTDERLRERTVGIFDGMTFLQAQAEHPQAYQALISKDAGNLPSGAETDEQCYQRVSTAIVDISARYPLQTSIVVSHGIAMYQMLLFVSGLPAPTTASRFFTLVDNASISVVQRYESTEFGSSWRLCHWNDNRHLPPKT